MAYEWRGKVIEGEQGDRGPAGDKGEKGPMGSATKQPMLNIYSTPVKTGKIYFYTDRYSTMYSTGIVATGTISVFSNEKLVTSAEPAKLATISILLPACEAPTEENQGEGTFFYGYVDRNIDLSGMDATTSYSISGVTKAYRISDDGDGACTFDVVAQTEKPGYGGYAIIALKLSPNPAQFSTFLY